MLSKLGILIHLQPDEGTVSQIFHHFVQGLWRQIAATDSTGTLVAVANINFAIKLTPMNFPTDD